MKRICPACQTRRARLVAADCPVCEGAGVLSLGPESIIDYGAETTSRAVSVALEAVARHHDDPKGEQGAGIAALRSAVAALAGAGLLAGELIPAALPRPSRGATAVSVAQVTLGVPISPTDWILPDAAPYRYKAGDRPGARGLPLLSDDGHPSHLARIADPANPIDTNTTADVYRRAAEHRAAVVLAAQLSEEK